jgi:hypothetical protein
MVLCCPFAYYLCQSKFVIKLDNCEAVFFIVILLKTDARKSDFKSQAPAKNTYR